MKFNENLTFADIINFIPNLIAEEVEKMSNLITSYISSLMRFFVLAVITGVLLGLFCSKGFISLSFNSDNLKKFFNRSSASSYQLDENRSDYSNTATVNNASNLSEYIENKSVPVQRTSANTSPKAYVRKGRFVLYPMLSGDTITKISRRFKVSTEEILATNGVKDENRIRTGDEILIPIR